MMSLRPFQKVLLSLAALGILVTLIVTLWRSTVILGSVLMMLTLLLFLVSGNRARDAVPFCTGALLGPLMEAIVIRSGAWQYAQPTFAGIPLWLPFLWGLTAVFLMKISRWCLPAVSSEPTSPSPGPASR